MKIETGITDGDARKLPTASETGNSCAKPLRRRSSASKGKLSFLKLSDISAPILGPGIISVYIYTVLVGSHFPKMTVTYKAPPLLMVPAWPWPALPWHFRGVIAKESSHRRGNFRAIGVGYSSVYPKKRHNLGYFVELARREK